jgi:RND family efflux transporter MFP subunit
MNSSFAAFASARVRLSLLLVVVTATGVGCNKSSAAAKPNAPPEVKICQPETGEITDYDEFTGRTDAYRSINLRARVTGYLDHVFFKEGADNIKPNDVLFEIDPRTYKADRDRAFASLEQAKAHADRLRLDYNRGRKMFATGAIGQEEYDKINSDLLEAEAAVGTAKAGLDQAELNLSFCKVRAPLIDVANLPPGAVPTWRISRQNIDPGNLVKADDTILTTLVTQDPIYVYYDVDERSLLRFRRLLQEKQITLTAGKPYPVEMGLSDEANLSDPFPHKGYVGFTDNQVDVMTGTLRVRGVFPNPASSSGTRLISPGQFSRVRIPIGEKHPALLVPDSALSTDQGEKFLYVAIPDPKDPTKTIARHTPVEIGSALDGLRVVKKGLKPGEWVVVNGLQRVRDKAEVQATKVAPRSTATPAAAPVVDKGAPKPAEGQPGRG